MAAARIVAPGIPLPQFEMEVFSNRQARDDRHFGLMLRATAFVPWINGLRTAVEIDGESYMDGGLVDRTPLEIVPEGEFDELWIAACSPSGIARLAATLSNRRRTERLVVISPGAELPAGRWTMDWATLEQTIAQGQRDMTEVIEVSLASKEPVVHGVRAGEIRLSGV